MVSTTNADKEHDSTVARQPDNRGLCRVLVSFSWALILWVPEVVLGGSVIEVGGLESVC
jgi:hypothetical protein